MIFCLIGILLYGFGTALYLTCYLGAGPRDGLMVGICQRFHLRINVVRTSLEISVCLLGFLLGGVVGLGTVLFATSIGGVVQFFLNIIARLPHIPYEK
ncbi:membrane protein [Haemophilus influenzae]|nr:membrane protein [Haemophilus influenzae]